ncbi:hypothetical protein, partial [Microbulbifer sp.]|uniref:hypothetical protein n=1 Tax=Microbulbifer sp. TaxID=1908541 RepID=UPI003F3EE291
GSFALVNIGRYRFMRKDPAREFLFHEYTHFLTYGRSAVHYPYWYSEGFAEVFSTVSFPEDGKYLFGDIPMERATSLYYDHPMPLEELLRATPAAVDRKQASRVYAGGWMLTHWLIMSSGKTGAIGDYLGAYNRGEDPVEALVSALGMPLEELEGHYLAQAKDKFPRGVGQMPPDYKPVQPRLTPISRQGAVAEVARYLVMSGRNAESLQQLVTYARDQGADSHELTSILASAETEAGEFSRAESMLASIPAELHGEQWFQHSEAALWLKRELAKGIQSDPERLAATRDRFVELVNADEQVPAYWHGLAIAMQKLGYPRHQYLEMLEQAYVRAPRNTGIAWWYAYELYFDRNSKMFSRVARPLLMQITADRPRARLQSMLADLQSGTGESGVDKVEKNSFYSLFAKYREYAVYKAIALALDYKGAYVFGSVYDSPDQDSANSRALQACETYRVESNVEGQCRIYAEGDKIIDAQGDARRL